jgi:hypothetical protein
MLDLASLQNSVTLNAFCLRLEDLSETDRETLLSDREMLMASIVHYDLTDFLNFVN